MTSDFLEKYVLRITEPFDYTLENKPNNTEVKIIVETIHIDGVTDFLPRVPVHSGGTQHLNVGLDLFSATAQSSTPLNPYYHYAIIRTGIKLELPYGHHMMIGSRSGLGFKNHIQAFPGIIDHSYRGEILIKLYSPIEFTVMCGDKIAQGLIFNSLSYILEEGLVDVNTDRGNKGFGSTDT